MFIASLTALVLSVVFISAAGYGRAMDELFGSTDAPRRPSRKPSTPGLIAA